MPHPTNSEIHSSRELNAAVESVYQAFANPELLKVWWGPEGFTNTIHEFDLRPGGKWLLTILLPNGTTISSESRERIIFRNSFMG